MKNELGEMVKIPKDEDILGSYWEDKWTTYRVYRRGGQWVVQSWPASEPTTDRSREHGAFSGSLKALLDDDCFHINREVVTNDPVVLEWLQNHPSECHTKMILCADCGGFDDPTVTSPVLDPNATCEVCGARSVAEAGLHLWSCEVSKTRRSHLETEVARVEMLAHDAETETEFPQKEWEE